MAPDPAEQIALFRYRVIAEVLSDRLSPAERGLLVRELAARAHELPDGSRKEFSRATLDRWIRAYRESELAGLYPKLRSDRARSASSRNCWRKPLGCVVKLPPAPPSRSRAFCWRAMGCASRRAPSVGTSGVRAWTGPG